MSAPVLEPCGCTTDPESGLVVTPCPECREVLAQPSTFKPAGEVARDIVEQLLAQSQGRAA